MTGILLTLTAAALGAVFFDVGGAKRVSSARDCAVSTTAAPTISGPARVIDGDTVVVAGTTVRLKGVDAAELGTARGENARRVMATLVTGQADLSLDRRKDLWPRGRLLHHSQRHRHQSSDHRLGRCPCVPALR